MTSLAISLLFALFCAWAILLPFYTERKASKGYAPDLAAEAREKLLSNLEELEFDYLAKKISEEDYLRSKNELLKEA